MSPYSIIVSLMLSVKELLLTSFYWGKRLRILEEKYIFSKSTWYHSPSQILILFTFSYHHFSKIWLTVFAFYSLTNVFWDNSILLNYLLYASFPLCAVNPLSDPHYCCSFLIWGKLWLCYFLALTYLLFYLWSLVGL